MAGFIVKKTIVENRNLVIELYGIEVFIACMIADDKITFLEILRQFGRI